MPIETSPRKVLSTTSIAQRKTAFNGHEFVALLRTNPALAQSTLMLQLTATYNADTVRAQRAAALIHEARPPQRRSRQLAGTIDLHRNTTSAPNSRGADLDHTPTTADLANLVAAEELAHDLFAAGWPTTLPEQAACMAFHAERVADRWTGHGLERRTPMFIEAAARYLTTAQPDHLHFATTNELRKWHADTRDTHLDRACNDDQHHIDDVIDDDENANSYSAGLDVSFIRRRRIVWTHSAGPAAGLLLDRFHPACRPEGVERDRWARRKVAEDLKAATAFLAPAVALTGEPTVLERAILGVRVLAHRAPNVGVHFLPRFVPGQPCPVLGDHHPLGGCATCATTIPSFTTNATDGTATGEQVQA